jgi:DNA-binding transcriptional ArsR family regulator
VDEHDVLRGKTAQVYRYALKMGRPIGVREVQRALKLSSPRLASYHLERLEETGLLRQTPEGYVVDKVVLENFLRLQGLLVPKYFFFFVFFVAATIFQLVLFWPSELSREYLYTTTMLFIVAAYFGYETVTTLRKKKI